MEEVDAIIIPILREIGCAIPPTVTTIASYTIELFYNNVVTCLLTINPELNEHKTGAYPMPMPKETSTRFRMASRMSTDIKKLGFTSKVEYNSFLYTNENEMRKLLIWLVDKLPKPEQTDGIQASIGSGTTVMYDIQTNLRAFITNKWTANVSALHYYPISTFNVTIPTANASVDTLHYYKTQLPYVQAQGVHSWQVAPSLFEQNTTEVLITQEQEKEWAEQDGMTPAQKIQSLKSLVADAFRGAATRSAAAKLARGDLSSWTTGQGAQSKSAFSRRTDFEQERDPALAHMMNEHGTAVTVSGDGTTMSKEDEKSEEAIREEREKQLSDLQATLNELMNNGKLFDNKTDQFLSTSRQIESELTSLNNQTTQLEDAYKVKKRTLDLLPDAQKNLAELAKLVESSSKRLVDLGIEWESHRLPLITKLRRSKQQLSERKEEVGKKVEQIKRMREEMKEKAADLRDKDKLYKQVVEELNAMPKSINRQVYVRRIMDIMKNLEKQKEEIRKILADVRQVQKDINMVSETSKRSFAVADEVVFQAAKKNTKDETTTKAYKYVVTLREGFVDLVNSVEQTGKTQNEVRDITSQIDDIESRNTNLNMERVLNDLAQVKKENKALTAKLKGTK